MTASTRRENHFRLECWSLGLFLLACGTGSESQPPGQQSESSDDTAGGSFSATDPDPMPAVSVTTASTGTDAPAPSSSPTGETAADDPSAPGDGSATAPSSSVSTEDGCEPPLVALPRVVEVPCRPDASGTPCTEVELEEGTWCGPAECLDASSSADDACAFAAYGRCFESLDRACLCAGCAEMGRECLTEPEGEQVVVYACDLGVR